ncbi:larval cuticle protein 16/17-like [Zootermopsis nevadensis]|uniref:Uncharacterized protein n=1 Tax=Zootermopsis nevadensis TaxID=136037 RepID=A0A067RAU3_ZOONE|nr:larval cuticle protein 16/17-like [Zootermopsis nevadensis]KDR20837.1 hypothetical protein L798_04640 [Zootermopsis nevadensis]
MARRLLQMSAVLLVLATTESAPSIGRLSEAEWESYHETNHQGPGTYAFGYDVEDPASGNTQFRQEERHPNGTVTGSYGVIEPDGNVRIVRYIADSMGYRATMQTTKKRFGSAGTVGSRSQAKITYPHSYNSVPRGQVLETPYVAVKDKPNSKFYFLTNNQNYIYKN